MSDLLLHRRNYHAKNPMSSEELMRSARGAPLPWPRRLREAWAKAVCALRGHDMALDRWHNAENPHWFEQGDYEIHIGCRRCPELIVVPASFERRP